MFWKIVLYEIYSKKLHLKYQKSIQILIQRCQQPTPQKMNELLVIKQVEWSIESVSLRCVPPPRFYYYFLAHLAMGHVSFCHG